MTTNWAGNFAYSRPIRTPDTFEKLQAIIAGSEHVRAVGTAHSFGPIADSPTCLVGCQNFSHIAPVDETTKTVRIGAGVRYGELAQALQSQGFALHNLASLPHISVAGAIATATHGSGDKNGNLATAVRSLTVIDAQGNLVTVDEPGSAVHLGLLGVVVELELTVLPTFNVTQTVLIGLPKSNLLANFDSLFGLGYSVSFFTKWSGGMVDQVWVKSVGSPRLDLLMATGAVPSDVPLHPAGGKGATCSEQLGKPGPWSERLAHFRMEYTPSNGSEFQSEYFVPRRRFQEAFDAVRSLGESLDPDLHISELRSIAADNLWMSPCNRQPCIGFHFTWRQERPDAVWSHIETLEEVLLPLGARPHFGKLFKLPMTKVRGLYPQLPSFRELAHRLDPGGKFVNPFLKGLLD